MKQNKGVGKAKEVKKTIDNSSQPPQKKYVILLFLLSGITFGIYTGFWFIKRAKELNNLSTKKKMGKSLPLIYLILIFLSIGFLVVISILDLESMLSSETILMIITLAPVLFILLAIIFLLMMSFKVRVIINEALVIKGSKIKISGFYTFLFNFLYLQYEINRIIDDKEMSKRTGPLIWTIVFILFFLVSLAIGFLAIQEFKDIFSSSPSPGRILER